jgi:hypothetical protein
MILLVAAYWNGAHGAALATSHSRLSPYIIFTYNMRLLKQLFSSMAGCHALGDAISPRHTIVGHGMFDRTPWRALRTQFRLHNKRSCQLPCLLRRI